MTPRERVLKAINREWPDKAPKEAGWRNLMRRGKISLRSLKRLNNSDVLDNFSSFFRGEFSLITYYVLRFTKDTKKAVKYG